MCYARGFVLHFMFVVEINLVGSKHDSLKSKLKMAKVKKSKIKTKIQGKGANTNNPPRTQEI